MATRESTLEVLERMMDMDKTRARSVLVVGDGMTDVYVQGQLQDTCQDGCPKFSESSRVQVSGGAANAARSLMHWNAGIRVMYYGPLLGPTKTRYMIDNKVVFRADNDRSDANLESLRDTAIAALLYPGYGVNPKYIDAVLLSDYDKDMLTPEFISQVAMLCKDRGIPCVADCKREPGVYGGCILKCNVPYYHKYHRSVPFENLVVTDGAYGPEIWQGKDGPSTDIINGRPVECVNHVGAGDCFAAHLTLGLAYGLSLRESAAIAHSAGRVYVQQPYNTPPTVEAIREDVRSWEASRESYGITG